MFGPLRRQLHPRLSRSVSQALAEPMAWNQAPTKITTLPNGLRVATKESFSEVASLGVFLDAGVRSETPETAGATHLIEALALTGTSKRPLDALESEVESMGGVLSMTGGREFSNYTLSCMGSDAKQGIDILSDLVTDVPVGNLGKEKESILRNLEELDQPTRSVIDDRLHITAFRDCSLGYSTIGPFEGIDNISSEALAGYVGSNFTAEKMVLVAAGPMAHEEVVEMATASMGSIPTGVPAPYVTKPYFCGAELIYRNDEMGALAYVSVGYESVPWKSPDAVTFMIMKEVIGSYNKSAGLVPGTISGNRVHNAIANKMGVGCAEEAEAFNCFYKDTGLFGWYVVCDEVAVEHAVGELMFGVNVLAFSITDEEVERAKRALKISLFGGSGSADDTCATVGQSVLAYGREIPAAEMMLRIEAIDAEEVKRVAWEYLQDAEIAVTGLGPLHGMPHYMVLRNQSRMHRY